MHIRVLFSGILIGFMINLQSQNLTVFQSKYSVKESTERIISIIKKKNLVYFETVAHDEIAKSRGIKINPTKIILFEDSEFTSNLISCEQTVALDLPLKIMVWEESGDVYIGYIDPLLMRRRFLIKGCAETLTSMSSLMNRIVNESLRTN